MSRYGLRHFLLVSLVAASGCADSAASVSKPQRPASREAQTAPTASVGKNSPVEKTSPVEKSVSVDAGEPTENTRRMSQRLVDLANRVDVSQMVWLINPARAKWCKEQMEAAKDSEERTRWHYHWVIELLRSGENAECTEQCQKLLSDVRASGKTVTQADTAQVRLLMIQAALRTGELENCCARHNQDSCLFPLFGKGIYDKQQGPREAIRLLNLQLAEAPDLTGGWLLNLAYMMIGEYPAGVPSKWLIDPKVFESDYDIQRFPDVAPEVGLDAFGLSGGCVVEDQDGDGDLDVMRSNMELDGQLRYFQNDGDGKFSERTKAAGLTGEFGGLNLIHADFDNDGRPDVLVLRGGWMFANGNFPMSLLRNLGDGRFDDVTESAHLDGCNPTQTAVWLDYNNDGWLDLFVGNESTPAKTTACSLYRSNRDGTFTECAAESGVDVSAFVKGVISGDFNNDGRPDLYVSCLGQRNWLLQNDGPADTSDPAGIWRFSDVASAAGVQEPIMSFPCCFWDYDNDGWQDLFVCGYHEEEGPGLTLADYIRLPNNGARPRLYRNNQDGTFADVTAQQHLNKVTLGMGMNFGDLDNDGWLDLSVGTGKPEYTAMVPNRMFRNNAGRGFQCVTTSGGFGHLQKGHGQAFADLNNDGQQDVYAVMGGAFSGDKYYSVLFANPGHDNRWIKLQLEGVESNRSAIGARLKVTVQTADGEREIHRTISHGGSFGSSPLRQEVGLGQALAVKSIEVFWPRTGQTQVVKGVEMERFYKIREGEAQAVEVKLVKFDFPHGAESKAQLLP